MKDFANERWLPVPGFEERYDVSDMGRVRSHFDNFGRRRMSPKILKPGINVGYEAVSLCLNRKIYQMRVQRLVLLAFVGEPPNEQSEGRHLNGVRRDNSLGNLAWGSRQENAADLVMHGTLKGEGNPRAKLSADDVRRIRTRHASGGCTHLSLAKEYGVAKCVITFAINRQTWSHVT